MDGNIRVRLGQQHKAWCSGQKGSVTRCAVHFVTVGLGSPCSYRDLSYFILRCMCVRTFAAHTVCLGCRFGPARFGRELFTERTRASVWLTIAEKFTLPFPVGRLEEEGNFEKTHLPMRWCCYVLPGPYPRFLYPPLLWIFPRFSHVQRKESERVHFFLATLGEDSGARTAAAARKGRPVLSKRQWLLFRPYTQRCVTSPVRFRFHRFVFPILSYQTSDPSGQSHLLFAVVVRRGLALCSTAVQWFRALERRVGSEANLSQNPYRGRIPMWLPQYRQERIKTRTLALVASQCRNRVLASRASLTKTAHSHRLHRARSLPQASQRYTRDRDHVGVFRSGRRGIVRTVVLLIQNVHVADS